MRANNKEPTPVRIIVVSNTVQNPTIATSDFTLTHLMTELTAVTKMVDGETITVLTDSTVAIKP